MTVSYKKLWKLLIDKNLKKKDLIRMSGISNYTLNKLNAGKSVTTDTLVKICATLHCGIDDITRDTEAVKRISTAYLKLLFPHVQDASEIAPRDFKRYCFERARKMRQTIKFQVGILDEEYRGKDMPAFKIKGLGDV